MEGSTFVTSLSMSELQEEILCLSSPPSLVHSRAVPPPTAEEHPPVVFEVDVFGYEDKKIWKAIVTLDDKTKIEVSSVYFNGLANEIKNAAVRHAKGVMYGPQVYFHPRKAKAPALSSAHPRVTSSTKKEKEEEKESSKPKYVFAVKSVLTKDGRGQEKLEQEIRWKLREK